MTILENEKKVKDSIWRFRIHIAPSGILSAFLAIIFLVILITVWFMYRAVELPEPNIYEIVPGATSREIAYDLARKRMIRFPMFFNLYLSLKNLDTELQAGRYEFPKSRMSLREIAAFLTSGAKAKEIEFTVPEGYTRIQIAELLEKRKLVEKGKFLAVAKNIKLQITNYKLQINSNTENSNYSLEGFLFPDTYRVYEGATVEEIIQKMLDNFESKITPDLQQEAERQKHALQEIIIMASILEREVRTESDMKKVADILWRRLASGWALEVDSTLKYEIGGANPSLTYDELLTDSPYNTYKYKGLPPTPIGNPGLKAITAAIYPESNDYWFYLSKPDGETVFAKTLPEHSFNKRKYLQ